MKVEAAAKRYLEELMDLWSLSSRAGVLLPRLAKGADEPEIARTLRRMGWATLEHRRRLEKLLSDLGEPPIVPDASSGAGVLARAEATLRTSPRGEARDLVLIGLAQRLAHLGLAGYGIARTLAEKLEYPHHAAVLQTSLEESAEVDLLFTRMALFGLPVERAGIGRPERLRPESGVPERA